MNRIWPLFLAAVSLSAAGLPSRIVSLSPHLTEILYGVGAFDRVVGVSDYCIWPAAVKKLLMVGGWRNPSLERLAALHPDLVLIDSGQAAFVQDNLKALGLNLLALSDGSVEDVYRAITTVGRATGREEQAARLASRARAALAQISQSTATLAKPSVVLIVDRSPSTLRGLVAATPGNFLGELVAIAGGRIVAPPLRGAYGHINKEDLLALSLEVILDFVHGSHTHSLSAWQDLPEVRAVRQRRVYFVTEDYVPHASQRMVQTAELFARLIHNRRFP